MYQASCKLNGPCSEFEIGMNAEGVRYFQPRFRVRENPGITNYRSNGTLKGFAFKTNPFRVGKLFLGGPQGSREFFPYAIDDVQPRINKEISVIFPGGRITMNEGLNVSGNTQKKFVMRSHARSMVTGKTYSCPLFLDNCPDF